MTKEDMKIEVIGSSASGKSTLCHTMSELGWQAQFEQYEINPFLSNFSKYGIDKFENQMFFLLHHYNIMKKSENLNGRKIYDFSFILDGLYASILLSEDELNVYNKLMSYIQFHVGQPDCFIKLVCPDDILYQRMAIRNRDFEQVLDKKFLQILNLKVNNCILINNMIVIDSSKIDLKNKNMVYEKIIKNVVNNKN